MPNGIAHTHTRTEEVADESLVSTLMRNPRPVLVIAWALSLARALWEPLDNLFGFRYPELRASHNWFFWLFIVVAAAIAYEIYKIPGPPDPTDQNQRRRSKIFLVITILVAVAPVAYGTGHYFVNDKFNLHRFQVEQLECPNQIQAFLRDVGVPPPTTNMCVPEIISPVGTAEHQSPQCILAAPPVELVPDFWRWLFGVRNYFAAMGKATVVFNELSIKATASWAPIASMWFKNTGATRIEATARGDVTCVHSQSAKTCDSPLLTVIAPQATPDEILKATAAIKTTMNGDRLQVEVITQLFANPAPIPISGIAWGAVTFNPAALGELPHDSPPGTVTLHYRCRHLSAQKN